MDEDKMRDIAAYGDGIVWREIEQLKAMVGATLITMSYRISRLEGKTHEEARENALALLDQYSGLWPGDALDAVKASYRASIDRAVTGISKPEN